MENYNTYLPPAAINTPSLHGKSKEDVKKAAQDFEAMFIAEMLRPAFEAQETDPNFGGGESEKIYKSMLVDEYGKKISQAGGIGVAANVEKEMLKLQEAK